MTKLSIILANYNHSAFLPECLDSILSQSFQDFELIVIDDASTDHSVSLIKKYQKIHPQIKLLQNAKNLGPVHTYNRGMEEAKGEYLAFCAADDLLFPDFFSEGTDLLDQYPKIGMSVSDPAFFKNKRPYKHHVKRLLLINKPIAFEGKALVKLFRQTPLWIHSHGTLYRKSCANEYGLLNPKLKWLTDWHFNHVIAINHGIVYSPKARASFRQLENSYSSRCIRKNNEEIFNYLVKDPFINKNKTAALLLHIKMPMLIYILKRPQYWTFLPAMFEKALRMIFIKCFKKARYNYEY
ncbi:MAG: glycosyltransferase family 2 protein [Simkaniaceae bacterium]|nr:glycosyltransferase family 2 protein [Simkaniaceae bacterium]